MLSLRSPVTLDTAATDCPTLLRGLGLAHGPSAGGGAGPDAVAAVPLLTALLPAAANQGHPGALQARRQAEFPSSLRRRQPRENPADY